MVLSDGIRIKKCELSGNNIVVNGEEAPIYRLEELEDFTTRIGAGLTIYVIGSLFVGVLLFKGVVEEIIATGSGATRILAMSACAIVLVCMIFVFLLLVRSFGYESYWLINGKKYLCLEKTDGHAVYDRLKLLAGKTKE